MLIITIGGSGLLAQYKNSLLKTLEAVYPEQSWHPWLFPQVPDGYWNNIENQKKFFDQLAAKWNIQKADDWNKVTLAMVTKEGGYFLAVYYNNSLQRGTVFLGDTFDIYKHYKQSVLIMCQQ